MMPNNNPKGAMNPRYKTAMCKNYNTEQGCQYGDKCQFAHGPEELRTFQANQGGMMPEQMLKAQQMNKNMMNYKIVKCKNFEKDGTCKYGAHCSFAHGDAELRPKMDPQQMLQMAQMGQMPMMMPGYMYDYSMMMQMQQGIDVGQMDPNMFMQPGFDMNQMAQMGSMPQMPMQSQQQSQQNQPTQEKK